MKFKDAFEHVKAGNATDEEAAFVEEELEKNQLISEYLAPDCDGSIETEERSNEELKTVKKLLRKCSPNIIVAAVSIVIVLVLAVNFIVIPILNQYYYNPMTKTESNEFTYDINLFMAAYTELHHAGYRYENSIIENVGIGKYAMTFLRYNLFQNEEEYLTASLDKNKLTMPFSFLASALPLNIFARASSPVYDMDRELQEHYSTALKELPNYIDVITAVSFSKDLTMDELITMEKNSAVNFMWAGIRNAPEDRQRYPLCGMDVSGAGIIYERINEHYPAFELALCSDNGNHSASDYETHFKSLLQYIIDHPDFLDVSTSHKVTSYDQSVLDYVTDHGVKSYGVLAIGTPSDILDLMDNGFVSQFWPLDANIII